MKFAIITHVDHLRAGDSWYGYSAYVREMNLWGRNASQILIVAPVSGDVPSKIHLAYEHPHIKFTKIPAVSITSFAEVMRAMVLIPVIVFKLFRVMRSADHVHLRCPGTIGLLGCCVQVFFPKKPKTAKYAGNWDPKAKQPRSYRFQKWLLSNTFFTKNMKVLVYGEWPDQSKNIVPFFTASYNRSKIEPLRDRSFVPPFKFIFVGTLSEGKRPGYAVELVNSLRQLGIDCRLDFYGDGAERTSIEKLVARNSLEPFVKLHGNETAAVVEEAYKNSHFLVLPSRSEGWPKVVAEAMFWGCVPLVTSISCVRWMLAEGERGILLTLDHEADIKSIAACISEENILKDMSVKGQTWSQNYTLDKFEEEIKTMLQ